jgi:hypothetical protein
MRIRRRNPEIRNMCDRLLLGKLPSLPTLMPFTSSAPQKLISLSEVARRANISIATAVKLANNGILKPDAYAGRTYLYRETRWEELREAIRQNVISYSPRDYADYMLNPTHPLNPATAFQA